MAHDGHAGGGTSPAAAQPYLPEVGLWGQERSTESCSPAGSPASPQQHSGGLPPPLPPPPAGGPGAGDLQRPRRAAAVAAAAGFALVAAGAIVSHLTASQGGSEGGAGGSKGSGSGGAGGKRSRSGKASVAAPGVKLPRLGGAPAGMQASTMRILQPGDMTAAAAAAAAA